MGSKLLLGSQSFEPSREHSRELDCLIENGAICNQPFFEDLVLCVCGLNMGSGCFVKIAKAFLHVESEVVSHVVVAHLHAFVCWSTASCDRSNLTVCSR